MPWHRYEILSLQLGCLEAFLKQKDIDVCSRHYYKDIVTYLDLPMYESIVNSTVCDLLFASLLFPDRKDNIRKVVTAGVSKTIAEARISQPLMSVAFDFDECLRHLCEFTNDILNDVSWDAYSLVGFTSTHVQLTSSLLLAKSLKEQYPNIRTIFGGFLLRDDLARNFVDVFPYVDFVVSGEGEVPLHKLCVALEEGSDLSPVPNLVYRHDERHVHKTIPQDFIANMDELPTPDFSDYFEHALKPAPRIHPVIQLETSRGCRWGRCSFCVETMDSRKNYRRKSAGKVIDEIATLTDQCKSLSIMFADADLSNRDDIAGAICELGLDLQITAEITGFITKQALTLFRKAGAKQIQIGVESFSPRLLKVFNKGVKLMRYAERLKWCKELGIKLYYNMILGFPLETEEDMVVSVKMMDYLRYFQYPEVTHFTVSFGAEVYRNYEKFGIETLVPNDAMCDCYPKAIVDKLTPLLSFGEHTGYAFLPANAVKHDRVLARVEQWKMDRESFESAMVCRRGKSFLEIAIREGRSAYHHIIRDELEIGVYLFCVDSAKRLNEIVERFAAAGTETVNYILWKFVCSGLMFTVDGEYLSLASREDFRSHINDPESV